MLKYKMLAIVFVAWVGISPAFAQGVWISTFERRLFEQGRWHQLGNCKKMLTSKDPASGKRCLKITFGGISKHEYAGVGFARLNNINWKKNNQIVFRFKGDGSDNIVRLSILTVKNGKTSTWTWQDWIYSKDGAISTALADWREIKAPLKEFVNSRNNKQKLPLAEYKDIQYIMLGLESAAKVKFPINQSFSFYLDDIAVVPENESFPSKPSSEVKGDVTVNFKIKKGEDFPQELTCTSGGSRYEQLLNGYWDFAPFLLKKKADINSIKWDKTKIIVPSMWYWDEFNFPDKWKSCQKAWYGKTIEIPQNLKGKVFRLCFGAVAFYCEIYVNGKKAGKHVGDMSPFEIDISHLVKVGDSNRILIFVQDRSWNIKASLKELETLPSRGMWNGIPNGALRAPMSPSGGMGGIWQDVWLKANNPVYTADAFIKTSVVKKKISVDLTFVNHTNKPVKAILKNTVFPAIKKSKIRWFDISGTEPNLKNKALDFPEKEILLKPGKTKIYLSVPWENPNLWSPDSPSLYYLQTRLDKDQKLTRFGFREINISGKNFYLNGKVFRFRGDCPILISRTAGRLNRTYMEAYFENCRKHNINLIHSLPENIVEIVGEIADEKGVFLIPHLGLMQRLENYVKGGKEFFKNCKSIFREIVVSNRNHPSVFMYGLSDEIYIVYGPSSLKFLKKLAKLITPLDPTRPLLFSGDGDVGKLSKIFFESYGFSRNIEPYRSGLAKWIKKGDMPCFSYFFFHDYMAGQIGDHVYSWEKLSELYAECNKDTAERLRMAGVSAMVRFGQVDFAMGSILDGQSLDFQYESINTPFPKVAKLSPALASQTYTNPGWDKSKAMYLDTLSSKAMLKAYAPLFIGIAEGITNFYSQEEISKTITVCNDTLSLQKLKAEWHWLDQKKGERNLSLKPGEIVSWQVKFPGSKVTKVLKSKFQVELRKNGKVVSDNEKELIVYPRLSPVNSKVVLYDPKGNTTKIFKRLKIPFSKVKTLASLSPESLLIIGFEASDKKLNNMKRQIVNFVNNGGRVLALRQEQSMRWTPLSTAFSVAPFVESRLPYRRYVPASGRKAAYFAIVDTYKHPVFNGFADFRISNWRAGDHRVGDDLFYRPSKFRIAGNYRVLASTGATAKAVILEQFIGKGNILLCQFDMQDNLGIEPEADLLLFNMINYLSKSHALRRQLYVLGTESSKELTAIP